MDLSLDELKVMAVALYYRGWEEGKNNDDFDYQGAMTTIANYFAMVRPQKNDEVAIPTIQVTRKGNTISFFCSFCQAPHIHGCAGKSGNYGHRVAHCIGGGYSKTGYFLTD